MDITQLILDDHLRCSAVDLALLEQIDSRQWRRCPTFRTRLAVFLEVHAGALRKRSSTPNWWTSWRSPPAELARSSRRSPGRDLRPQRDGGRDRAVRLSRWAALTGGDAIAAAVNVANNDHMAEEEREGLTDFTLRGSAWPQRQ